MSSNVQTASDVAEQAKQQVAGLAGTAQESAISQLSSQKHRATQGLGQISNALHQTSTQLRQQQSPVGDYVDRAAQQVDKLGGYLQQHEIREIVTDVRQFARRRPEMVMGAALALGFVASRFMKSSSRASAPAGGQGYPGGYAGSTAGQYRPTGYAASYPPANRPTGDAGVQ